VRDWWVVIAVAISLMAGVTPRAYADLHVSANSVTTLNAGEVDLACTDLIVAGTLRVTTGRVTNVRHVSIQPGGTIDGGSGTIALGGNWSNAGSFVAGSANVHFRDLCGLRSAAVTGNTTFSTASFTSTFGKSYVFAVGSTQFVTKNLEIAGTAGQPIAFRSSASGQVANIDLAATGTQQIQQVAVTDVWATGQWLAPGQTNAGGGGNAKRWFGDPQGSIVPVPALGSSALAALALLLAASSAILPRRRKRSGLVDR
jgi:hypothetical protein